MINQRLQIPNIPMGSVARALIATTPTLLGLITPRRPRIT